MHTPPFFPQLLCHSLAVVLKYKIVVLLCVFCVRYDAFSIDLNESLGSRFMQETLSSVNRRMDINGYGLQTR